MRQLEVRSHVARTRHTCTACGDPIERGDRYVRLVVVDDGIEVVKIHHYENPCKTTPNRSHTTKKDLL